MPEIWLLGSSGFSAQLAGLLGLPFSFAHHFSAANTVPALALYRQNFRPSRWLDEPHAMVAVNVICADTDERARVAGRAGALSFLRLRSGPAAAAGHPARRRRPTRTPTMEREFVRQRCDGQAVGSPETVRRQLTELLERTGADELMLTTMVYDIEDRVRSFELVAEKVAGGLRRSVTRTLFIGSPARADLLTLYRWWCDNPDRDGSGMLRCGAPVRQHSGFRGGGPVPASATTPPAWSGRVGSGRHPPVSEVDVRAGGVAMPLPMKKLGCGGWL